MRADAPGRTCPPSYGYSPRVLARPADVSADVLYVIGGLYGNALALEAIERMAAQEAVAAALVFNGDFHWFDAEPAAFAEIQRRVLAHHALRGNVETEIASDDAAAGCGCAYPESVPDDDVARSNAILDRLRDVAAQVAGSRRVARRAADARGRTGGRRTHRHRPRRCLVAGRLAFCARPAARSARQSDRHAASTRRSNWRRSTALPRATPARRP